MFRFRNLLVLLFLSGWLSGIVDVRGEYFLYSPDLGRIVGYGRIEIRCGEWTARGRTLVIDTRSMKGRMLGGVTISGGGPEVISCHDLRFSLFPLRWQGREYSDSIVVSGDGTFDFSMSVPEPDRMRRSDLFFELGAFRLYPGHKIVGERVVPFLLGAPSLPVKKLLLKQADIEGRTVVYPEKIAYSQRHGLLLDLGFNLFEKWIRGTHHLKLFERELFSRDGPSRGLIFEAADRLVSGDKSLLTLNSLVDSDDRAVSLKLGHDGTLGAFRYALTQSFSAREGEESVSILDASIGYDQKGGIKPQISLNTDFRHSFRWQVSSRFEPSRNLRLNLGYEQNRVEHQVSRRENRLFGALTLSTSVVSVDSSFEIVRDQIELRTRRAFSLRCPLPTLRLMDGNVAFEFVPFYSFSSLPAGDSLQEESTPGFSAALHSYGVRFPLGILFRPKLDLYHIWDQGSDSKTSFNTSVSLEKRLRPFSFAVEYSLASRLRLSGFWIEGQQLNRLGIRLDILESQRGGGGFRFSFNNRFELESISFTGRLVLPWRFRLNGMLIYSEEKQKLLSLDVYLERDLLNTFKLRGGYSLALKRFFIDFMQLF